MTTTTPDIITLSREQGDAVVKLVAWFKRSVRQDQIFTLAGFAGTGKSTTLSYAIRALGLTNKDTVYACFTGKASLVLIQKGLPAMTIHRFCYTPKLKSTRDPITHVMKTVPSGFSKKPGVPDNVKLIVIDEVSMVSAQLLKDLASFNIKILVLGDPGQLAPVMGKGTGLLDNPDVFLKEIHRQAKDSPIIWASMLAREGRSIPYGTHGSTLKVVPRNQVSVEDTLSVDQVLTCMHVNRIKYNKAARAFMGYDTPLPQPGEKLICRSNRWDDLSSQSMTPLVNGLQVRVRDAVDHVSRNLRTFKTTYHLDGLPDDLFYYLETNLDYFEPMPNRDPDNGADVAHLDFSTAITTHSAQGSQYATGIYVHDAFGPPENRRQLLYTGITRFSQELTIAL